VEKYCRNNEWFCAHRTSGGWSSLKNPAWLIYTHSRGSGGRAAYVRTGSCVTSIAGPNGDTQLYER
jgi:hypothetical protein